MRRDAEWPVVTAADGSPFDLSDCWLYCAECRRVNGYPEGTLIPATCRIPCSLCGHYKSTGWMRADGVIRPDMLHAAPRRDLAPPRRDVCTVCRRTYAEHTDEESRQCEQDYWADKADAASL